MKVRSWWTFFRERFRPPRTLRVTRLGRTYLVLTLGVGLGALNTGNNLLYLVLGLMLSSIVMSGVLSERALRSVCVERLGADAAFAGEPFAFRWRVSCQEGPAFSLELREEHADLTGAGRVAAVEPGQPATVRGDLVARHRGPCMLSEVRVTTTYPLGLFAKSRFVEGPGRLLVFPARLPKPARSTVQQTRSEGPYSLPLRGEGDGEVSGLAPLREGDDVRRVHWRKSAAWGSLIRTQREVSGQRSVTLRLPGSDPSGGLDAECSQVAAAAHELLAQGFDVGLETDGDRLRPAAGALQERRILQALAWVGFEEAR